MLRHSDSRAFGRAVMFTITDQDIATITSRANALHLAAELMTAEDGGRRIHLLWAGSPVAAVERHRETGLYGMYSLRDPNAGAVMLEEISAEELADDLVVALHS